MLKSESGASAVEFGLLAPLLFAITFGIIEFGLLLYDYAVITNASREGARAAVVYTEPVVSDEEIKEIIISHTKDQNAKNRLVNLGIAGSRALTIDDISVEPPETDRQAVRDASGYAAEDVVVEVKYSYDFLVLPNITKLLDDGTFEPASIPLKAVTKMRME